MGNPIYFTDMGQCEPNHVLSASSRVGHWSLWDYETDPDRGVHLKGRMIYASPKTESPPVTLRLNLKGPHALFLAFHYGGDPRAFALKAKLTKDRCFHRLCHQLVTPKDLGWLGRKDPFPERIFSRYDLVESFWRYEDLTGQEITFARPNPGSTWAEMNASVAWVKCVPLSEGEVSALKRLESNEKTKVLMGSIDGGRTFSWLPESREDLWEEIEPLRDSDVGIVCYTVARTDVCVFPTRVGTMRTREMGYYVPYMWVIGEAMERLASRGIDPLKETIDYAHELGVKILATNRPAAPHMGPNQEDMHSPWYVENTQWRCRLEDGTALQQMSFAFPEVAEKFLGIFTEALERGADGISMMWNRGWPWVMYEEPVVESFAARFGEDPRRLPRNDSRWMQHKADVMTARFVRPMRKILDEFGERRGERLEAAYYVHSRPEDCLYNALDVERWVEEGLVDYLMVHRSCWTELANGKIAPICVSSSGGHRWIPDNAIIGGSDDAPPVHETVPLFKKLTEGTGVKVYADVYPLRMPGETYIERANLYYESGADGLMYFCVDPRTTRKSEWIAASKMGHRELLKDWPLDLSSYFKVVPLKRIAGLSTDQRYDTTG